ncbi:MAG: transposase [Eubacteriales bacterium]
MKNYTTNKRYCPHEITTKLHSVQLYRQTRDISYVCRKYKVSKASLMRWNKAYDGTKESLMSKSHRPHTPHPNAHTEQEIKRMAALSAAKLRPMMAKRSKLSHKRRMIRSRSWHGNIRRR